MEPTKPEQTAVNDSATSIGPDTRLTQARSPVVHGFTYFVRSGEFIKIGQSMEPNTRIKGLQTGFPEPLEVLVIVPCSIIQEMDAHAKFAHLRTSGEWFLAVPELLDFIETLKAETAEAPIRREQFAAMAEGLRRRHSKLPPDAQPHASNLIRQFASIAAGGDADRMKPFIARSTRRFREAHH